MLFSKFVASVSLELAKSNIDLLSAGNISCFDTVYNHYQLSLRDTNQDYVKATVEMIKDELSVKQD